MVVCLGGSAKVGYVFAAYALVAFIRVAISPCEVKVIRLLSQLANY